MLFKKHLASPRTMAILWAAFATLAAFFQGLASRNHEVNTTTVTGLFEAVDQTLVGLLLLGTLASGVAFYWTTLGRNIPVFAAAVAIATGSFMFSFGPGFLLALFYMLTAAIIEFIRQTTGRHPNSAFAPYDAMAYISILIVLALIFTLQLGSNFQTWRHGKTPLGGQDIFVLFWIGAAILLTLVFCIGLFERAWQRDARYYWCGMLGIAAGPVVVGFTTAQFAQHFYGQGVLALVFFPIFLFSLGLWIVSVGLIGSLILTAIANRPAGVLRYALG